MQGEVVGINTAIFSQSGGNIGIGFAIPINLVKDLLPQLKTGGKITRGWLGVSIQGITPDLAASLGLAQAKGALVSSVVQNSPADQAGIRTGDVIVGYAGKPINNASDLPFLVAGTPVGQDRIPPSLPGQSRNARYRCHRKNERRRSDCFAYAKKTTWD